jgi:hypothetical protein
MKFRASGAAPLFTGTDGLTEAQEIEFLELCDRKVESETNPKKKLTDIMEKKLESFFTILENLDKGIIELSQGAKTYIEEQVEKKLYGYDDHISTREMEKGTLVEDVSIERLNTLVLKSYKKSESKLEKFCFTGHPDIECEKDELIIDIKSPFTKKTFPKNEKQGKNTTYDWQIKLYLYMKGWRKGKLAYVLTDTPDHLIPDNHDLSLHDMGDLPLELCVTIIDIELLDKEIAHIERRGKAALKYAAEYEQELLNKNK